MRPSAYDVAHLAGVSQAAVSRAFTPGASIAKATRERVMSAARKLGYRPNLIARSLSMGRSGIVGVVLGIPENPAHIASFQALSARITKAGKQSMVFTTAGNDYIADVHIEDLLRYRVDALVLISANLSPNIAAECRAAEIPVIYLTRLTRPTEGMTSVTAAYAKGATEIAAHLVTQGYRRLAYMSGFSDSPTSRERESAFTRYLAAKRLPPPQRVLGDFKWKVRRMPLGTYFRSAIVPMPSCVPSITWPWLPSKSLATSSILRWVQSLASPALMMSSKPHGHLLT